MRTPDPRAAPQTTLRTNPNRHEVAAYVATLTADLGVLARGAGLSTVAYLLDMARLEAETTARELAAARDDASKPAVVRP